MATLTRSNSRANPPIYKDYVNFLASYKNGKKEDENTDCGIPVKNFSLASSSTSTSSSSLSSDVTDFSKTSVTSYNSFLENSKKKKFSSVKPAFEENTQEHVTSFKKEENVVEEKTLKKSELYIEIQPAQSVSEVSKIFEHQQKKTQKSNTLSSKISIFEKQTSLENKPKIAHKPVFNKSPPPPKIDIYRDATSSPPPEVPPPVPIVETLINTNGNAPPPPPLPSLNKTNGTTHPPVTIISQKTITINGGSSSPPLTTNVSAPPPPPPPPASQPAKLQATLTKGPATTYSVNSPNGLPMEIDRNNPLMKKLVYGTLRGLYGAYHDKANDMLATLPKNMVVRSNGVQDRIEQIAANGDLDKLNGRINPKLEE